MPGWSRSALETQRMDGWPCLAQWYLVWWGLGVVRAEGQSGYDCLSLIGWSEWRRGRRRFWGPLSLIAELQGNGEWCYQPGSPPEHAAAPSSSPLWWRSRTLFWFYDDLESRVHVEDEQLRGGACGKGCWSDKLALQVSLWPGRGRRWPNVWGEARRCYCFGRLEVLERLWVETGRRGCGTPRQIFQLFDQKAQLDCCC